MVGALLAAYVGFAWGGAGGLRSGGSDALPASGRAAQPASLTFRLLAIPSSLRFVDRPPKNVVSKGDAVYAKDVLRTASARFNRPKNARVGTDSWVFTNLAQAGWQLATGVVKLPDGTLRFKGRTHVSNQSRVVPVVGGTGRYAKAHGTVDIQMRGDVILNDFRLRLG